MISMARSFCSRLTSPATRYQTDVARSWGSMTPSEQTFRVGTRGALTRDSQRSRDATLAADFEIRPEHLQKETTWALNLSFRALTSRSKPCISDLKYRSSVTASRIY